MKEWATYKSVSYNYEQNHTCPICDKIVPAGQYLCVDHYFDGGGYTKENWLVKVNAMIKKLELDTNFCAECDDNAQLNDYLCQECRSCLSV